ncbi:MAG: glycosyltransferase [Tannerellaceae bacterium]|jgi:glycosyltransferase involved in cell wall biosynthesis|nr:glycosyltransferase [Tannerellaceae bacterium]
MKKVLVICDMFPPAFGPRMGYLCKYLGDTGWEATVLTEKIGGGSFAFLRGGCSVHALTYYPAGKGLWAGGLRFLLRLLSVVGLKDYVFFREAKRLLKGGRFELILCSTYRDFPLGAASRAARRFGLPWVADLRDIVEQYAGLEFIATKLPSFVRARFGPMLRRRFIKSRNLMLQSAAHVTCVSPFHLSILRPHSAKISLIYNGYDPEIFRPRIMTSDCFIISYTGRLLSGAMRDPSLLFEAIRQLSGEGLFSPSTCRVEWYTDEASWLAISSASEQAGVGSYMHYKGYVAGDRIPAVLAGSSVALLLANKESVAGPRGIVTTKVFEAMAMERPILCVRSDEGVIAALLAESRCGLAASSLAEASQFLRQYYNQWLHNKRTHVEPYRPFIESFSRRKQAQEFAAIFEEASRSKA